MKLSFKEKLIYFSPWFFASACALLFITISLLTVNTYKREQELKENAVLQQAQAVVRIIYNGVRKPLRDALRGNHASQDLDVYLQSAIEGTVDQIGLEGVVIVNEVGEVLNTTFEDQAKVLTDEQHDFFLHGKGDLRDSRYFFQKQQSDGAKYLVLAQLRLGESERRMRHHIKDVSLQTFSQTTVWAILDLNLDLFNSSFSSNKTHIYVLSLILSLVIVGSVLSFLALRNLTTSQHKLLRISRFHEYLLASLPLGLISVNMTGRMQICNKEATRILGVSQNAIVGQDASLLHTTLGVKAGNDEDQLVGEIFVESLQKTLFITKFFVVNEEGDRDGFVLLIEDISEKKALQETVVKSARLASLGKMAAGVAHELRNPLSSIKGLGVLLQSRFGEDSQDYQVAGVLVSEVERLNRSITELLDFAKPKEIGREKVVVKSCLEKAIALVAVDIADAGIDLQTDLPSSNVLVQGDEDKLNQVFLNLLLNSLQAVESVVGGGNIEVTHTILDGAIELKVRDNGCGIEKEHVDLVFDPYFTTKAEGTGLGLAVSAKIIEEHNGTLVLESDGAQGTTAIVSLPV